MTETAFADTGPVLRRAVFLDRDGTLTEPRHYPSRPDDLVLLPGIGPPPRALQNAGFALVVVTNQLRAAGVHADDRLVECRTQGGDTARANQ